MRKIAPARILHYSIEKTKIPACSSEKQLLLMVAVKLLCSVEYCFLDRGRNNKPDIPLMLQ